MKKAKHTPGPWVALKDHVYRDNGNADEYEWLGKFERAENAQVAAAAPDLLAALEVLVAAIDPEIGDPVQLEEWAAGPVKAARAVIAKAKGE